MPAGTQVYQITHRESGTTYFGRGHAKQRLQSHRRRSGNLHLRHAVAKYGWDAFDTGSVECLTPESAADVECVIIDLMGGPESPLLYNQKSGGDKPVYFNEEVRRQMSESHRQRFADPAERERQRASSKRVWEDPDYRRRMSEASKERQASPEYRERMSQSCKGVPKRAEMRSRLSASKKEQWKDPGYRSKALASITGRPKVKRHGPLPARVKAANAAKGRLYRARIRAWKSACGIHWVMKWQA